MADAGPRLLTRRQPGQDVLEILPRLGEIRLEAQRRGELRDRILLAPDVPERRPEAVAGLRVVGPDAHRLLQLVNRLLRPPQLQQGIAEVVPRLHIVRPDLDGGLKMCDRGRDLPSPQ